MLLNVSQYKKVIKKYVGKKNKELLKKINFYFKEVIY